MNFNLQPEHTVFSATTSFQDTSSLLYLDRGL